jgi:ADP-ribose pyrophosphatase YjhB (NUDIX family)
MDCTFYTEKGKFNYRVGAIITDGNKVLMARNPNEHRKFYYSVGGRVKFGESLEDAILREVKEETNVDCEIERLACLHENFFTDDDGTPFHEISVFFKIKHNDELLKIGNGHKTIDGPHNEFLEWIDLTNCECITIYPEFYKTIDFETDKTFKHFVTKD